MSTDWVAMLKTVAPTVATALGGPLAGAAVAAIGEIFGMSQPTQENISKMFSDGQLLPEHLAKLRELDLKFKNDERERGFKYAELVFKDRDSARQASVAGGTQRPLFWMSIVLLVLTLGTEIWVLFMGYPEALPEIIVGRVLGLMDSVAMMVLAYWYGTTNGSAQKTELLAATPARTE